MAMTLQAARNLPIFAVVAAPQVARYGWAAWSSWRGVRRRTRPLPAAPALLAAAVIGIGVIVTDVVPTVRPAAVAADEATRFPRAATDYVTAHLAGQRIYSLYEWGGYLVHRFPTQRVVYIYGESAVFGSARLERYLDIHLIRPDWRDVLATDAMTVAVIPAESQEATAFLEIGWTTSCHDRAANAVVMQAPAAGVVSGPTTTPPDPASAPPC